MNVLNILKNLSCIFASLACVDVSALNASSQVFWNSYSGRHQDHDVKVIKKAYHHVEGEFKTFLEGTKKFIKQLH